MSKKYDYIDIHGHVTFDKFDTDRNETITRATDREVAMITVGTDVKTSLNAVELAATNENMWATVGVHPTDSSEPIDWSALEELAKHPKVVGIGECGLDYFHSKPSDIERQKEIFIKHIELANRVDKPLMLHVRNGLPAGRQGNSKSTEISDNAYQDALVILKKHSKVRGNFHFFAGSLQDMKGIVAIDYTVSFTGVLTFTHDYDELVKHVPITHIMSETDCPFVAPVPHRGKRNEPVYVIEVVKAIARIRQVDEVLVSKALVSNAKNFFKL